MGQVEPYTGASFRGLGDMNPISVIVRERARRVFTTGEQDDQSYGFKDNRTMQAGFKEQLVKKQ
jgi:hypothetical protein